MGNRRFWEQGFVRFAGVLIGAACVASSCTQPSPSPSSPPTNDTIEVDVTILRLRAIDDVDPGCFGADFYERVSIDGQRYRNDKSNDQALLEDEDKTRPYNTFGHRVSASSTEIPIHIELWDQDAGLCGSDDKLDINPSNAKKTIDLVLNPQTRKISGDVPDTSVDNEITTRGGGGDRAEMTFVVTLETCLTTTYLGAKPKNAEPDWWTGGQGIAHDQDNWYFTNSRYYEIPIIAAGGENSIWRIPLNAKLNSRTPAGAERIPFPMELSVLGYDHFGDPDVGYDRFTDPDHPQAYLFVPVEDALPDYPNGNPNGPVILPKLQPRLAVFKVGNSKTFVGSIDLRALSTLTSTAPGHVGETLTGQTSAGWVAIASPIVRGMELPEIVGNPSIARYDILYTSRAKVGGEGATGTRPYHGLYRYKIDYKALANKAGAASAGPQDLASVVSLHNPFGSADLGSLYDLGPSALGFQNSTFSEGDPLLSMQGGAFTPWGDLYLQNGKADGSDWQRPGIHVMRPFAGTDGRLIGWDMVTQSQQTWPKGPFPYHFIQGNLTFDLTTKEFQEPEGLDWFDSSNTSGELVAGVVDREVGHDKTTLERYSVTADLKACGRDDVTAPRASPGLAQAPNAAGWHKAPVTVSWNWKDPEVPGQFTSGLAPSSQLCPGTSSTSKEGIDFVRATCRDNASNEGSAQQLVKLDRTPPTLGPLVVPSQTTLGSPAIALPEASDELSGISSATCDAVDTSTVGVHTVTCTATDFAGNVSTAGATYEVMSAPSGEPPVAVIKSPERDAVELGSVDLSAEGSYDPDRGPLTYRWLAQRLDLPNDVPKTIATTKTAAGVGLQVFSCEGTPYRITLSIEDQDGESAAASVDITVVTVC